MRVDEHLMRPRSKASCQSGRQQKGMLQQRDVRQQGAECLNRQHGSHSSCHSGGLTWTGGRWSPTSLLGQLQAAAGVEGSPLPSYLPSNCSQRGCAHHTSQAPSSGGKHKRRVDHDQDNHQGERGQNPGEELITLGEVEGADLGWLSPPLGLEQANDEGQWWQGTWLGGAVLASLWTIPWSHDHQEEGEWQKPLPLQLEALAEVLKGVVICYQLWPLTDPLETDNPGAAGISPPPRVLEFITILKEGGKFRFEKSTQGEKD